ncbi:WD40 repeat-like protein [Rhizoctonia solani]|uniref:WD40 repeat-like protein n=1 Tax=Rhizoctonia solani TaxID=456999 RepID=A0A8H7IBQ3_9AGAM|nr:WD40 repeat-like protein [Rhizoctonia solani]
MKISVLQHDLKSHLPQRKGDATPITRNLDPLAHPFSRARERTRALNAAKIERMFSKPFVASLEGHIDGVYTLATKAGDLETITSGSGDGEIIVHDLVTHRHLLKVPGAHKGTVSAITYANGPRLLSCGVDRTVKLWDASLTSDEEETIACDRPSQNDDQLFATASNIVQLWDETKSSPVSDLTFPTSNETVTALRFNLSESSILATTGTDRTLTLYDIRTGKAERRLVMQMRANALAWSPTFQQLSSLHPKTTTSTLLTYDRSPTQLKYTRVTLQPLCLVDGHLQDKNSSVEDGIVQLEYGKKAKEANLWCILGNLDFGRVFATTYTQDARFILSGSDDGNVRLWKARASEKLGVVEGRERASKEYRDRLRERWSMDKEVGRIERQQNLPVAVKKAGQLKRTMLDARAVKEERRRKHTRAGASKPKAERKKVVVAEQT